MQNIFYYGIIILFVLNISELASKQIHSVYDVGEKETQPEQIHLSFGSTPDQMVVTWVTLELVNSSYVEYGINNLNTITYGSHEIFTNPGTENRKIMIHRVILRNLLPNKTYKYHVGSPEYGWSSIFFFNTLNRDVDWSPKFVVYGDLGNNNGKTLVHIQEETQQGYYDAVFHIGDIAYNLDNNNGRVGDAFMNQIEPIAGYIPYMTCPGNHEQNNNFSSYVNRFSMPGRDGSVGKDNNHFFSINIGPAHIILFSTEFYYSSNKYGFDQIKRQYEWLKNDLENANLPSNREVRPWIIIMGHRPMYCSNKNPKECTNFDNRTQIGILNKNGTLDYGLEDLFYNQGVDLQFYGHVHSYERLWPIYKNKVYNGSLNAPYIEAGAPIQIVSGSAGCTKMNDELKPPADFTAFRSNDYGYTRLKVFNSSHVHIEQISDNLNGQVIDEIWVIRNKHFKDQYKQIKIKY